MSTNPSNQHNQRMAMGYEPIDRVKPNGRDPRVYSDAERGRIIRAVARFGPLPLVVDREHVMLSGNVWLDRTLRRALARPFGDVTTKR